MTTTNASPYSLRDYAVVSADYTPEEAAWFRFRCTPAAGGAK